MGVLFQPLAMHSKWCSGFITFGFQGGQALSNNSGTCASCQYNQGLVLDFHCWYHFLSIWQNLGHAFCKLKLDSAQPSAMTIFQL
jgi:hypothetical protein